MGKRSGIQFKITASAILCFLIGMLIILLTLFFYLRTAFNTVTEESFENLGDKYANMVKEQFENPVSFLSGVCSIAEAQMKTGNTDREALQQYIYRAYANYPISEGSAFMLEPNVYDGLDSEYVGTGYGTVYTGRISYYYWRENGQVQYLPQTEDDELEFVQPYYLTSKERKVPTFSEPYIYEVAGSAGSMITASYPMMDDNNKVLGIMTVDLYLTSIHETMSAEHIYETGYLVLISEEGNILYCPDLDIVGESAATHGYLYDLPGEGEGVRYSTVTSAVNGKKSIAATVPVELELADSRFYISVVAPESEAHAVYTRLLVIIVGLIVVVGAAIAVAISRMVGRTIRPLKTMVRFLGQVGNTGNLHFTEQEWQEIRAGAGSGDEIGESLGAFTHMLEQFVYYGDCLQAVASRDLTVHINTLSEQDTCGTALRGMVDSLGAMLRDIHLTASQVEAGAVQIDQASQTLAAGTSEQAAAIDHFTANITEIRGMAEESADIATETLEGVQQSENKMENCIQAMEQMLGAMQDIDQKSQSISRVIKVIDDIAFQTNILALNAAVEAARAGQHGKGFAVVADEVRNLASKSAEAANETAALIDQSLSSVSEGSGIVSKVNENLREVGEISGRNAASIRRLNEASARQRSSIESVTTAIQQLAAVVQANSATAEETASSAEEMSVQSVRLSAVIDRFRLEKRGDVPPAEISPQQYSASGFSL